MRTQSKSYTDFATGSFRSPNPTGLLTKTPLLNRERESFGGSGGRKEVERRSRAISGELSRRVVSPQVVAVTGVKRETPGAVALGVVR